jgi:serine/threonine-protein kinase HipA
LYRRLTPAYDLICTRLPIPSDRSLALTIGGKRSNLSRRMWLDFAGSCQMPERAAARLFAEQVDALNPAVVLIRNSFLPDEQKAEYEAILRENTEQLSESL